MIKQLVVLSLLIPTAAGLSSPSDYPEGACELAAKELQTQFGGSLVLVMAYLNDQNIPGKYSGAWLNRIYMKGNHQYYYIDYPSQKIFSSKEEANSYYSNAFKNKFWDGNVDSKIFIYGEDPIPFPIIWNY